MCTHSQKHVYILYSEICVHAIIRKYTHSSHILANTLTIHELEGRMMETRVIVSNTCTS